METKDEVSHHEHKFSEGAQHTDEEGPRSKAQGLPGDGNGVLAQKKPILQYANNSSNKARVCGD